MKVIDKIKRFLKKKAIEDYRHNAHRYRLYFFWLVKDKNDILEDDLDKYPYKIIYGTNMIHAITKYMHKNPKDVAFIRWMQYIPNNKGLHIYKNIYKASVGDRPDIMLIEDGKPYSTRELFIL